MTTKTYTTASLRPGGRWTTKKLLEVAGDGPVRAMVFMVRQEGDRKFVNTLKGYGYTIHTPQHGEDVDMLMAIRAVAIAPHVDTEILCTGDGDFLPLCRYLQQHGVRVEVAGFPKRTNDALVERADRFIDLSRRKFCYKSSRQSHRVLS